jgi:hypothetical protein
VTEKKKVRREKGKKEEGEESEGVLLLRLLLRFLEERR